MATPLSLPDRVDLLERLQDQQSALNDLTRQALATLHATLRTQQRTLDREIRMLDEGRSQTARHDAALAPCCNARSSMMRCSIA